MNTQPLSQPEETTMPDPMLRENWTWNHLPMPCTHDGGSCGRKAVMRSTFLLSVRRCANHIPRWSDTTSLRSDTP